MFKIVVTGPESSGKTTTSKAISNHFNISYSSEYARKYLNTIKRNYKQDDLIKIAKKQLKSEHNSKILDTDLITIKIWSEYKYGVCDNWILKKINEQKTEKRFYLLCKPDIAWEPDRLRENPANRKALFNIYKKELDALGHQYYIIENPNRIEKAILKVSRLI